ncbi:MAG: hypothetical protein ACTTHG_02685 [Treponemataceae bacterium]
MEKLRLIINSIVLVAMGILCATFKIRQKRIVKKLGGIQIKLKTHKKKLFIAVIVAAFAAVIMEFFRNFELYIMLILDFSAFLAVEMAIKDYVLQQNAGVYNNGLIVDGKIIKKIQIIELSDDSTTKLKIRTDNNEVFFPVFENESEKENAVEIIQKWL